MRQSWLMSLVETVTNVDVGYAPAVWVAGPGVAAVRLGDDAPAEPRHWRDLQRGLTRAGYLLRQAFETTRK